MKALWLRADKTAGLLGFGLSNQTLLDFLLTHKLFVTVRDRLPIHRPDLVARGVRFITGEGYLEGIDEDVIFRSPGIRPDLPQLSAAVARGTMLFGEYDLFAALCPATLLGVTGSDGKTTTTTVAGLMLREAGRTVYVGGNIGRPLISALDRMSQTDFALAELSSFQLMTTPRPPHRAVMTNLTENHLNWHNDMAEYGAAKANILGPATHAVLNAENDFTAALALRRADKTVFSSTRDTRTLRAAFGSCHTVCVENGFICYDGTPLFATSDIILAGKHNVENYLAAIGLVYPYTDAAAMQRVARSFKGVAHRMECVGTYNGVTYYNSSIDSTPSRTAATLAALGTRPIVLCGGADKGLSLAPLREALLHYAKAAIFFGASRERIRLALADADLPIFVCYTMAEAIAKAQHIAKTGDTVLLSPACTSFDEFHSFEERGECFCRAIREV